MTYNLDESTDFQEVTHAQNLLDFLAAVTTTIQNVRATNPPARAAGLAQQIAQARPDLASLEEVSIWRTGAPSTGLQVGFDFLDLLLGELSNQGQHYASVAVMTAFESPAVPSSIAILVQVTNREVMLARTDFDPEEVQALTVFNLLDAPKELIEASSSAYGLALHPAFPSAATRAEREEARR